MNPDCTGRMGIHSLQKAVASVRQLSYGIPGDAVDEYCRLSETTTLKSLREICRGVVAAFGLEYLRAPTQSGLQRIEAQFAQVGFPGCMGCVDCAGWDWKNAPKSHQGHNVGKDKVSTLRMEVICDLDLWIWHCAFGYPGSMNDINILDVSPHFAEMLSRVYPPFRVNCVIAQKMLDWLYYLADGIYQSYKGFVKTLPETQDQRKNIFRKRQEAVRKVVERVFGVLFARWNILYSPGRLWSASDMEEVVSACVILHNMIVEQRIGAFAGNGTGAERISDTDIGL